METCSLGVIDNQLETFSFMFSIFFLFFFLPYGILLEKSSILWLFFYLL